MSQNPDKVPLQLLRFALAGTVGFVVDSAVLYLALMAGLGFYTGRGVSFLCAVFVTWQINRNFTFTSSARTPSQSLWREWWRYLIAMSGGGAVNYLCYTLVIFTAAHDRWLPIYAVAAGSIAGLGVNFLASKYWAFRATNRAAAVR